MSLGQGGTAIAVFVHGLGGIIAKILPGGYSLPWVEKSKHWIMHALCEWVLWILLGFQDCSYFTAIVDIADFENLDLLEDMFRIRGANGVAPCILAVACCGVGMSELFPRLARVYLPYGTG